MRHFDLKDDQNVSLQFPPLATVCDCSCMCVSLCMTCTLHCVSDVVVCTGKVIFVRPHLLRPASSPDYFLMM